MKQERCFCDLCDSVLALDGGTPERSGFAILFNTTRLMRLTCVIQDGQKHICEQCISDITAYDNQFAKDAVTRTGTERER